MDGVGVVLSLAFRLRGFLVLRPCVLNQPIFHLPDLKEVWQKNSVRVGFQNFGPKEIFCQAVLLKVLQPFVQLPVFGSRQFLFYNF